MKIEIFTIRKKHNKELIFAEGTSQYDEYCSFFELDPKWLTKEEVESGAWSKVGDKFRYNEEVRHLINSDYNKIYFSLEDLDFEPVVKKEFKVNSIEDFDELCFSKLNNIEAQLELSYNSPKGYYETVKDWVREPYADNWISEESRELALELDNIWTISFWEISSISPERPINAVNLQSLINHYFELKEPNEALNGIELNFKRLIASSGQLYITYKKKTDEDETYQVDWVNEEDKMKAFQNERICEVQVYPQNPIGSFSVAGSSLKVCLEFLKDK